MRQKILVISSQLCSFRTLWLENTQESFSLIGNHCNSDIHTLISKSVVALYHKKKKLEIFSSIYSLLHLLPDFGGVVTMHSLHTFLFFRMLWVLLLCLPTAFQFSLLTHMCCCVVAPTWQTSSFTVRQRLTVSAKFRIQTSNSLLQEVVVPDLRVGEAVPFSLSGRRTFASLNISFWQH